VYAAWANRNYRVWTCLDLLREGIQMPEYYPKQIGIAKWIFMGKRYWKLGAERSSTGP
jgi:hypothetical protein